MFDVLVIMAKAPQVGKVKTRLAASVGADAACELYLAFIRDIRASFTGIDARVVWAMSPPGSRLDAVFADGRPIGYIDQRGDSLATRMWNVFTDLFAEGARRVVMIGADAPLIDETCVRLAFERLADNDIVLVPSSDGGYCLVALCRPLDIFTAVEMGSSEVLQRTRDLSAERGASCCEMAESFDVDDIEDVRALIRVCQRGVPRGRLRHTRETLRTWQRRGWL